LLFKPPCAGRPIQARRAAPRLRSSAPRSMWRSPSWQSSSSFPPI